MNTEFQNKMFSYKQEPPPAVWDNIIEALDSGTANVFSNKLYQYAPLPPETIWTSLESQLDLTKEESAVPFYRRYRKSVRFASAGAAIFIIVILGNLLISKRTDSEQLPVSAKKAIAPSEIIQSINPVPEKDFVQQTSTSTTPIKRSKIIHSLTSKLLHLKAAPLGLTADLSATDYGFPKRVSRNSKTAEASDEKYMIYIDERGNAYKLPKKLYNKLACPINDSGCKDHLNTLREKLSEASISSDFTGLLDMLSNVKENQ